MAKVKEAAKLQKLPLNNGDSQRGTKSGGRWCNVVSLCTEAYIGIHLSVKSTLYTTACNVNGEALIF